MPLKEFSAETGLALADDSNFPDDTPHPVAQHPDDIFAVLPINVIVASLTNPRKAFDPVRLSELAADIQQKGLLQPILVRKLPAARLGDTFNNRGDGAPLPTHEIVFGERRFRASLLAGRSTISVNVRDLTDIEAIEIQLTENLHRDGLTELEEAEGYQLLCDATGITKEDVGGRIKKSRSYVYARMKLIDLTTAPREALRAGTIDASRALLIARIPNEKLQVTALAEALAKDGQGSHRLSVRDLQVWMQQNVMLKLKDARFPIQDLFLVEAAGACGNCPKRTSVDRDLFSDVDGPDMCIDPVCFHGKEARHLENIVATAEAAGMRVIEGNEAMELKRAPHHSISGYEPLDSDMRSAMSERDLKGGVVLFVDPHGKGAIEVVSSELAHKARSKKNAKQPEARKASKERSKHDEIQATHKLAMEYQTRWRQRAIELITPHILADEITSMSANLMRRLLLELSAADSRVRSDCIEDILSLECDCRNFDDVVKAAVKSLDDNHVGRNVLLMLLEGDSRAEYSYDNELPVIDLSAPVIEDLASLLGINIDAIKAYVQDEVRNEFAVLDVAAKSSAAPLKVRAKAEPKTKTEAPAARPRKSKPTKAEAQADIAAAFQALDQAPVGASTGEEAAEAAGVNDMAPVGAGLNDAAEAAVTSVPIVQTSAVLPPELLPGDRVQFKAHLRDSQGHMLKCAGKEGTVIAQMHDGRYHVKYGKLKSETEYASPWDLEPPPQPAPGMFGGGQS
jgi:ParB/RepB/Spo0J family partition protein